MKKQYPSIFNDVLGPSMRGPSSSHTAASVRIGRLARDLACGTLAKLTVEFTEDSSLASCYVSQWVDRGIAAGALGMEPDDERLSSSLELAEEAGIDITFRTASFPSVHPNTYRITVENSGKITTRMTAVSIGGGMIEVREIEGFEVNLNGGFHETFIIAPCEDAEEIAETAAHLSSAVGKRTISDYNWDNKRKETLFHFSTEEPLPDDSIKKILKNKSVKRIISLSPVLPVVSQINPYVPFTDADGALKIAEKKKLTLPDLGVLYECERSGMKKQEVLRKMDTVVRTMKRSLDEGLRGTEYEDRLLGCQSAYFDSEEKKKRLIPADISNRIIKYVTAIMEVKSSMGAFIAAPTAGSSGCVPGTVLAVADTLNISGEQIQQAMLSAGVIGIYIAHKGSFAAETGGCQAECGSASGMAAAALVTLMGGSTEEAFAAASMALMNVFGLTCDPVGMEVEVPCLGKNIMCALNALSCANMVLAGFDHVIPLDETVDSFVSVGKMIPRELRCTGCAGITQTPTAKRLTEERKKQ